MQYDRRLVVGAIVVGGFCLAGLTGVALGNFALAGIDPALTAAYQAPPPASVTEARPPEDRLVPQSTSLFGEPANEQADDAEPSPAGVYDDAIYDDDGIRRSPR